MRKINIKDILLDIDMGDILNNIKNKKSLYIDIDSKISFDKECEKNQAVIFKNENLEEFSSITDLKELASKLFSEYKPVINGSIVKIKPLNNWQNIIEMNKNHMLYYDHQSDGVEIFEDSTLEDYGWNASALEINYRTISDFIEENSQGTLLFYDNDIQFNGFCVVDDLETVRAEVKDFIIKKAKENLENNLFELDDEDAIEALEFFNIEVN